MSTASTLTTMGGKAGPIHLSRYRIYGLGPDWCDLLEEIASGDGVISPDLESRLRVLTDKTEATLDEAAGAIKALEAEAAEMKAEAARLSARARTPEGVADAIREVVGQVMDAAALKSVRGSRYTVSRLAGRESVAITNQDAVPREFWIPQPDVLDKKAVGDALKAKQEVPGAEMQRGKPSIAIR